uniref:Uncharacterized protein n=1 Tax=Macrostomum lignano TaxID=282301 RepID=A0A1I8FET0_9PLAT
MDTCGHSLKRTPGDSERRVPFVAWGAGIRGPRQQANSCRRSQPRAKPLPSTARWCGSPPPGLWGWGPGWDIGQADAVPAHGRLN